MNQLEKKHYVVLVTLVLISMVGLWCVDVSTTTILMGGGNGVVTNGFYTLNPFITYHIGMYAVILCITGLFMLYIKSS